MITSAGEVLGRRLRRRWRRWADAVTPPPLILMYHRIADDPIDPWQLCVSPARFAAHMERLASWRRPMALAELTDELARGRCPRGAAVVTFDDGYEDNLSAALPVLEACAVPATVFCTAGVVAGEAPFWWDRLAGLLLRPAALPPRLVLDGAACRSFELQAATGYDAAERAADRQRRDDGPASARLGFYREVWAWLRPLAETDRRAALDRIAQWCDAAGAVAAATPRPLSQEQARRLAASRWIEIGAHTMTHAALSTLPADAQRAEIAHSKQALEALVGRPVNHFAYPFGDQGPQTAALVREAGFRTACTTETAALRPGTDPFQLPRVAVGDWSADAWADALRGIA